MTTETGTFRSRRALLGAALGGAAAVAAQASTPLAALGANNETALLGVANQSTLPTSFENTTAGETSLIGLHGGAGAGVAGQSATGTGLSGRSTDVTPSAFPEGSHRTGVLGTAGDATNIAANTDETGVYGYASVSSWSNGVWGDSFDGTGVYGTGATGLYGEGGWGVYGLGTAGVVGDSQSDGIGVYGFTGDVDLPVPTIFGVGVYAKAATTSLTALYVDGKARFSRSRRVSIGATKTSLKVTMSGVSTSSYILATLQTSISGCYVRAVVPASGYFTIYLSKAPGKTAYIGYLVIN